MTDFVIHGLPAPFILSDTGSRDYVFESTIVNESVNISWQQGFSQPLVRTVLAAALLASGGVFVQAPSAEIVTADKWLYALSEPVRTKAVVAFQQFLALNPSTPADVVRTASSVLLGTSQQLSRRIVIGY